LGNKIVVGCQVAKRPTTPSRGEVTSVAKKGNMTVREAGKKGGSKGGETTARKYGHDFYEEIGHKGGQKVKHLIEEGKKAINK
jgi:uncharacterized protein